MNFRTVKRNHLARIAEWPKERQYSREEKLNDWYSYIEELEREGLVKEYDMESWTCPY